MTTEPNITEVQIAHVQPGDVIVYRSPTAMSPEDVTAVGDRLAEIFPGHQIAILDEGGELQVLRPEKE